MKMIEDNSKLSKEEFWDIVIKAGSPARQYWRDLWHYRELFFILSLRNINVRYKQTVIGLLWAVFRPTLTMIVFTIIFSKIAKLPSDGEAPYAIMVYAAMLPWQFFASAVQDSSNSLIGNVNLISKVYFPRLIIPISTIITSFIDFIISFAILFVLMIYYRFYPNWNMLLLPFFLLIAFLTAMGIGLFITSLNVKYRDFRFITPFIIQFGLYISPVGFSSNIIPERYRLLYSLNPMVGVIDGFRWTILGGESHLYWQGFWLSISIMLLFIYLGFSTFIKMERTFADMI